MSLGTVTPSFHQVSNRGWEAVLVLICVRKVHALAGMAVVDGAVTVGPAVGVDAGVGVVVAGGTGVVVSVAPGKGAAGHVSCCAVRRMPLLVALIGGVTVTDGEGEIVLVAGGEIVLVAGRSTPV
jgi:hypothetical protein